MAKEHQTTSLLLRRYFLKNKCLENVYVQIPIVSLENQLLGSQRLLFLKNKCPEGCLHKYPCVSAVIIQLNTQRHLFFKNKSPEGVFAASAWFFSCSTHSELARHFFLKTAWIILGSTIGQKCLEYKINSKTTSE